MSGESAAGRRPRDSSHSRPPQGSAKRGRPATKARTSCPVCKNAWKIITVRRRSIVHRTAGTIWQVPPSCGQVRRCGFLRELTSVEGASGGLFCARGECVFQPRCQGVLRASGPFCRYFQLNVPNPLQDAQLFELTMRPSCLGTTRYLRAGRASRPARTQVPRAIMKVGCRTGGGEIALHPIPGGLGETPSRRGSLVFGGFAWGQLNAVSSSGFPRPP